jgi:hypothetical protein
LISALCLHDSHVGEMQSSLSLVLLELTPAGKEDGEAEAGALDGTRVETVLPLIRIFLKITLIVMAVLISLSALGLNIGPLIPCPGVESKVSGENALELVALRAPGALWRRGAQGPPGSPPGVRWTR